MSNEVNVVRNGTGADGNQRACAHTRHRRSNDQVAKRTGVGSRIGMMMPDRTERSPQQQYQENERDYHAPDSFSVGHFGADSKDHVRDRR